jgi:hypothetical protein
MPRTTGRNTIRMPSRVLVELGRVPVLEHNAPSRPSPRSNGGRRPRRRIGPIGTASRLLVGLALLYLGLADGASWGLAPHEAILGLVAFPAGMVTLGLSARLLGVGPIRFDGPGGIAANTAVIAGLLVFDYTASAAALFYGTTLLLAAWRAQPGCEATVLSNWILGRDDQIGCPTFTPIDNAEARQRDRRRQLEARKQPGSADERRVAGLGDLGLAHVVACCGVGAAALLAMTLT